VRRIGIELPVITIDPTLKKSSAERNKSATSKIGKKLGIRSPLVQECDPLPLPMFTKMLEPKDPHKDMDLETPLSELIKPRRDLLRTPTQIDRWFRKNYHKLNRPMQYAGHEANCTVAETMVEVDRSLYEIGALVPNEEGFHVLDRKVVTDEGESESPRCYSQPEKVRTVRFKTSLGFDLEGTPKHRVRSDEYEWRYLEDIQEGEWLTIQLGSLWPEKDPKIPRHVNHRRVNAASVVLELPERLDEDWAEVLGWWTAEGSYQERSIRFAVNTLEKSYFLSLLDRVGLPYSTGREKEGKDSHWVLIHSASLTDAFREVLKLKGGAIHKHVPWPVLRGTQKIVRAYLSGLASGDGNTSQRGQLRHRTSSERLAREVQQLWRRLGVPAGRTSSTDERTEISGSVLRKAVEVSWCVQTCQPWTPVVAKLLRLVPHKQRLLVNSSYSDFPNRKEDLQRKHNRVRLRDWKGENVLEGGICGHLYVKVREKETGFASVYDLVVPENHTYIANGFVSHNTDDPTLYDAADLRVLVVRLSTYDSVNGSLTHGALAQLTRLAAQENNFNVYVDHGYMPGLSTDAKVLRENKVPWIFGRTSRRHPQDFDVILFSFALTLETWNILPAMIYSGVAPFKTMRQHDKPLNERDQEPVIIFGGVVSDFIESMYGEVEGHNTVCDATVIGDGEYPLQLVIKMAATAVKEGWTRKQFLRAGHDLSDPEHFERDIKNEKNSWWYEPDLYEHHYKMDDKETVWTEWDIEKDPETKKIIKKTAIEHKIKYNSLYDITRKPGYEYAAEVGQIKRSTMRDLNKTPCWEEAPIQYDGSLGPAVDIQISSGCTCVIGDSMIETDFGFETIKDAYERLQEDDEIGGALLQTRQGMQAAEAIVHTGKKKVREYTFRTEGGTLELKLTCTDEHRFDTQVEGDAEPTWTEASDLEPGQEVWAVDPAQYLEVRDSEGKNLYSQRYYAEQVTLELSNVGESYETDTYDVQNSEVHEYIVNGLHTHNSGGMCSFCLAEGTLVSVQGKQVPIETLENMTCEKPDDREFETPYGLQLPAGGVISTGKKECVKVTTGLGHELILTPEHELLTCRSREIQKVKVKDLVVGKDIAILVQSVTGDTITKQDGRRDIFYPPELRPGSKQNKKKLGKGKQKQISQEQRNWFRVLRRANAYSDTIVSIEPAGVHEVYDVWDITKGHVFYANGFIVGNCHEAHTQGRWRERSLPVIEKAAERAIRKQGAQEVSFYSLTWSLHSDIYSLMLYGYRRFGDTNLISQRADQASADPDFFKFQNANGERTATIGVEGLSQRMRNFYNKGLSTEQLFRTCENAAKAGYTALKFFMIFAGLENKDDIEEFCELMREMNRRFKNIAKEREKNEGREINPMRITPSFMLLQTLPHTVLQWAPCTSAYDLSSDNLRPVVDTTREVGFGFRTSMTRERVRLSQVSGTWGREALPILAEAGLRARYEYYGPIPKRVGIILEKMIYKNGYDWMYWFREKTWDHIFPWDAVQTTMRRDYMWNQYLSVRADVGIAYCLKTSVNLNPKCSDCGACGTSSDRQFMLTREIETAQALEGQEASRRDMTVRKRVRWLVDIKDELLRTAPKEILARNVVRAFMLAAQEKDFDHHIIMSYLKTAGHSMKFAEGMGNLPWVGGQILMDTVFNQNWPDKDMRELIPRMNEILEDSWGKDRGGMEVIDFVASDKLVNYDKQSFALYTVNLPLSAYDLQANLEIFAEKESLTYKEKTSVGRDIFRMEEVTRIRSELVPMAYFEPTKTGVKLVFLCNLEANPMTILTLLTKKRAMYIKPHPITCSGYFRYDRKKADSQYDMQEDDLFAILEDREVFCKVSGDPIETDIFTGEAYRSKTAPDLCLASDLRNMMKMKDTGVALGGASVTR